MDDEVLRAQRAVGVVLLAPKDSAAQSAATAAYARLMDRASTRDQVAIKELLRVLGEPDTVATLRLEWSDIVAALPAPWFDQEIKRRGVTDLDLQHLAKRLPSRPPARKVVLEQLLGRLIAERDTAQLMWFVTDAGASEDLVARGCEALTRAAVSAREIDVLEWVCDHAAEPERTRAFQAIGRSIAEVIDLLLAAENSPSWPDHADEVEQAVDAWVQMAPTFNLAGDELPFLASRIVDLRRAKVEREGATLLAELQAVWQGSVGDLRQWLAHAEHLCRRADGWAARHPGDEDARLGSNLRSAAAGVRAHGRPWSTGQAELGWQSYIHLPAPLGACPYCSSWQVGPKFCRQCGSRV